MMEFFKTKNDENVKKNFIHKIQYYVSIILKSLQKINCMNLKSIKNNDKKLKIMK